MSSRTRVPTWTPGYGQSLRLVLRPAIAFLVFTALGFCALTGCVLWYSHSANDTASVLLACFAGIVGVVAGMLVSVARARALPIFVVGGISAFIGFWLVVVARPPFPEVLAPAVFFFLLAFPCGLLALQHRWELFASFWPAVGWIGGVFFILNENGRVAAWEHDKTSAWMPVPLAFLACFLVLWILYLASKQAMRVELWQSLSGAAARRISKKASVGALPRKNLLPILFAALLLFGGTAVLAPYLWRTGKGDKPSEHPQETQPKKEESRAPRPFDGEKLVEQLKKLAGAAKDTAEHLWPLLFLFLLYRPAKRALLLAHLRTPLVPTPPTERIDNLWEYVRIAAEDAGVSPIASDSVEDLLVRIRGGEGVDARPALGGPALAAAAGIYARTRYGFTVAPGDALAMKPAALAAAKELRAHMNPWEHVKSWLRPLA